MASRMPSVVRQYSSANTASCPQPSRSTPRRISTSSRSTHASRRLGHGTPCAPAARAGEDAVTVSKHSAAIAKTAALVPMREACLVHASRGTGSPYLAGRLRPRQRLRRITHEPVGEARRPPGKEHDLRHLPPRLALLSCRGLATVSDATASMCELRSAAMADWNDQIIDEFRTHHG